MAIGDEKVAAYQYRIVDGKRWNPANIETMEKIRGLYPHEYVLRGLIPQAAYTELAAENEAALECAGRMMADADKRADLAESQLAELRGKLEGLAYKWDKIGDTHGVRQFTGNDHKLFANELRTLATADGATTGETK